MDCVYVHTSMNTSVAVGSALLLAPARFAEWERYCGWKMFTSPLRLPGTLVALLSAKGVRTAGHIDSVFRT